MKNMLIYINPNRGFDKESTTLVRIQIDNSLDLGWNKQDIILVTNFEYEYNGIKSIVIGDDHFYPLRPRSTNTYTIPYLISSGVVEKGELYWVHDFDAYQMEPFDERDLGLDHVDLGLTDYGWRPMWCMGSFFFKDSAEDFFIIAKRIIFQHIEDEEAMLNLQFGNINSFDTRHKRLNITYNFGMRRVEGNYSRADKPLKVVHFHPYYRWVPTLDIFMYGKNGLNMPLMNDRLISIFHYHGVK